MKSIHMQIIEIMSSVFKVDIEKIPDNADPSIIQEWDSIKHLSLIIALEDHFNIKFTDNEFIELISLPLITHIIDSKYA